ncbi:MAG: hypothetical protein M1389_12970 [Chloroflexi bacterium]|nr:hypothetical protein [Chloroflexota bacterium]
MSAMTIRLKPEEHETLKVQSLVENRPMGNIIRDALQQYLERHGTATRQMRRLVVQARAQGSRTQAESLRLADRVAKLDTAEGLGEVRVARSTRPRAKRHIT